MRALYLFIAIILMIAAFSYFAYRIAGHSAVVRQCNDFIIHEFFEHPDNCYAASIEWNMNNNEKYNVDTGHPGGFLPFNASVP